MSNFLPLDLPREKDFLVACLLTIVTCKAYADDINRQERKYDPRCGMSKEEFEWRCAEVDRVSQRMPKALHMLNIQLKAMRSHFLDDPDALKIWDQYEDVVRHGFTHNLQYGLSSPLYIPNSVLYEQLMKRKAQSKTYVGVVSGGLDKLKQAAAKKKMFVGVGAKVACIGIAFSVGLALGRTSLEGSKKQTNETS